MKYRYHRCIHSLETAHILKQKYIELRHVIVEGFHFPTTHSPPHISLCSPFHSICSCTDTPTWSTWTHWQWPTAKWSATSSINRFNSASFKYFGHCRAIKLCLATYQGVKEESEKWKRFITYPQSAHFKEPASAKISQSRTNLLTSEWIISEIL